MWSRWSSLRQPTSRGAAMGDAFVLVQGMTPRQLALARLLLRLVRRLPIG